MSGMTKVGTGAKLEDSNLANYGSKEHKDARKGAAESEKEFVGAGKKPGLEVWRVENRRKIVKDKDTGKDLDIPDFGIKRWPKEEYGKFFSGDSYLVLNTYQMKDENGKLTDKLGWDVHFWLGKESSQDEIGVAAYKAVELDDLLDDGPVQHRECQNEESSLFLGYFGGIQYLEGGIASGFRNVKPEEYKPRLFQVRQSAQSINGKVERNVRAFEVPVKASSLNKGDTFILDAGLKVYIWIGPESNAFEKSKGGALAHNIVSGRMGKSKLVSEADDDFWKVLGGSEKDVQPPIAEKSEKEEAAMDNHKCKLFRLSDASGKLSFKKEHEGQVTPAMLDTKDAFILDAGAQIFIWIGKGASQSEKTHAMKYAMNYLEDAGKPSTTSITRISEGQVHHVFGALVKF